VGTRGAGVEVDKEGRVDVNRSEIKTVVEDAGSIDGYVSLQVARNMKGKAGASRYSSCGDKAAISKANENVTM
jgi:hypothetical protein